jgi:hypothetical protein
MTTLRRVGTISSNLVVLVLVTACGVSDPGYIVAIRNESDVAIVVRGDRYPGADDLAYWLLPPHSAGRVFSTIGHPREAPPNDYEILDAASCRILGVQHVDFALAPDPGFSYFLLVVGADMSLGLDLRTTSDSTISGELEATTRCPA